MTPPFSAFIVTRVIHNQQIEREKKEKKKKEQAAEEEAKASKARLIETVLDAVAKETLPTTAEAKEQYFMSQVAAGEQLCNAGKDKGLQTKGFA